MTEDQEGQAAESARRSSGGDDAGVAKPERAGVEDAARARREHESARRSSGEDGPKMAKPERVGLEGRPSSKEAQAAESARRSSGRDEARVAKPERAGVEDAARARREHESARRSSGEDEARVTKPERVGVEDAARVRRQRGIAMMKQVYGWDIGDVQGDFVEATVDHLFGEVWASGAMSVRERRLLLIGYLLGSGQSDVVGLQLDCAVDIGELSVDELREIVLFMAHYAGWPIAARMNSKVEEIDLRLRKAGEADETPER